MKPLLPFILLVSPMSAHAQALACQVPERLADWRVEQPPVSEVLRVPVQGYLLSLSWSPQFCRGRRADPNQWGQCGATAKFGFVLHGLWPEGSGQRDPAWCAPAKALPESLVRQHFCMTPSADLLQHEWAKHGTCMTDQPERYFRSAARLYRAVRFPDMDALARRRLTTGQFIAAFAAANPGLRADMIRISATEQGWLREVRLCLDTGLQRRACPRDEPGYPPRRTLRIWRDGRPPIDQ